MTEREHKEGNTDAPKVEEREVRQESVLWERSPALEDRRLDSRRD